MTLENNNLDFSKSPPFRLGAFWVQPDRNQLRKDDRVVSLEPRLMHVLVYLAGHPREVVTRQELKAAVWQDTLMGEDSLNRAISDLRRVFDDNTTTPFYIETIRKVGYRLVAPVTVLAPADKNEPGDLGTNVSGPNKRPFPIGQMRKFRYPILVIAILIGIATVVMVVNRDSDDAAPPAPHPPTPLTSEPGLEVRPALSPDGTRVAFAKKSREETTADIYVAQRNSGSPQRLTSHPDYENYPTWSPDGSQLAFVRAAIGSAGIFTVPAIGGEPSCIYRTNGFPRHLDWSPDGRWIVFSESPGDDEHFQLLLLDMQPADRPTRALTTPTRGEASDSYPRFSPAGDRVAFVRTGTSGLSDIFYVNLGDGGLDRLTRGQIDVWGLDWNSEGNEVYFSSFAGGPYGLSAVSLDERTVRRIPVLSEWVRFPTLARDAECLVFESRRETQDIMILSLDSSAPDSEPLIVSNVLDCEPTWSPDGAEIAFISTRSGHRELWVCDGAGSRLRQLTAIAGAYTANPVWAPDGRRLAFMMAADDIAVCVIDVIGGAPRRITPAGHNALPCSWSRDGNRVYYACDASGHWQIWQVDPDGGDFTQVTTEGGIAAIESPDGKTLYLVRPDKNGIWRRSVAGGTAERAVPGLQASHFQCWAVANEGIYFVRPTDSTTTVLLVDWRSGDINEIAQIPSYPNSRFSMSPDGKSLLFVRSDHLDIDLQLLDYIP